MKDVIKNIQDLCALLDAFAQDQISKKKTLKKVYAVLNDLAYRMRVNLEASKTLIGQYDTSFEFYLPLALMFRSIVSDVLTFCYVIRFYDFDEDDDSQPSLINEINILDKDFISALLLTIQKEHEVVKHIPEVELRKTPQETKGLIEDVKKQFGYLFAGKDFKSSRALRYSSLDKFFVNIKDREKPSGMMSETYKYDRIMEQPFFSNFAMIISVFKYYSAFHHYSPFSTLMLKDQKRNMYYIFLTIDLVYMIYIVYVQMFEKEDKQWLEKLQGLKKSFELVVKKAPI